MRTLILIPFVLLTAQYVTSQEHIPDNTSEVKVSRSVKPVFGENQQAIGDYLMKELSSREAVPSRRAAFNLLIDDKGKVTEAKLFYGSIDEITNAEISRLFVAMPAWKTTASNGTIARVLVVVSIKDQLITTEIY